MINVHYSSFLGEERGPVLEVIVSRTNFISSHTEKPVRKLEKEWTMKRRINRIVPCVGSPEMIMGSFSDKAVRIQSD